MLAYPRKAAGGHRRNRQEADGLAPSCIIPLEVIKQEGLGYFHCQGVFKDVVAKDRFSFHFPAPLLKKRFTHPKI